MCNCEYTDKGRYLKCIVSHTPRTYKAAQIMNTSVTRKQATQEQCKQHYTNHITVEGHRYRFHGIVPARLRGFFLGGQQGIRHPGYANDVPSRLVLA